MDENGPFDIEIFHSLGMKRRKCTNCGSYFWTSDEKRKVCGDPPCDVYTFIGKPIKNGPFSVKEMRKMFLDFFDKDHHFVKPYPVVPRWREDVLLVNASIYDFQPQVTGGYAMPPGNPLVMSQPCIRMIDVDKVGITGRHLTSFEMMCHDSFNYPDKFVYWNNETIRLCNLFLTERLGIDQKRVVYKEKPWAGGGNAGNALEVLISGLEVATLVFMDLVEDPEGDVVIEETRYSKMPMSVVDTGYGLERLSWLSGGTVTIFETVYPEVLKAIKDNSTGKFPPEDFMKLLLNNFLTNEGKPESSIVQETIDEYHLATEMDPSNLADMFEYARSCYILADHSRSLLFLLSDYVIPSNVKVGYLARLLARRAIRAAEKISLNISLNDLVNLQRIQYSDILEHFDEPFAAKMLSREDEKLKSLLSSGYAQVQRILQKGKEISSEDLVKLYDSGGLTPDFVSMVVKENTGKDLRIPDDFHEKVVLLHDKKPQAKPKETAIPFFPTRTLYYDDTSIREFTGVVLYSAGNMVVLNQTAFYPEGGGQPSDVGYLDYGGKKIKVERVEKIGRTIVHRIDGDIPEKSRVKGVIDYERRWQHMVHHSATHLLLGVMREVFGDHVWQSGVQKGFDSSRIDITHYDKLTREDIVRIENRCLEYISEGRAIHAKSIEWNAALQKYGFRLFQGGVPLDSKVRVVVIEGVDAEGCGGTHLDNTSRIGFIKIISTETIQEGIQRIIFAAGPAALRYTREVESLSSRMQGYLSSSLTDLPSRLESFISQSASASRYAEKSAGTIVDLLLRHSATFRLDSGRSVIIIETPLEAREISALIPRLLRIKSETYVIAPRSDIGGGGYTLVGNGKGLEKLNLPEGFEMISRNNRMLEFHTQEKMDESLIRKLLNL